MEHLVFTLVTFVLFTALVGIISGKIVKNSDDQKTAKGYFLAGNGLGGFFIAGSMLLTNLSAENLVGLSGQSYAANMSGMAWEATAVIATIIMAFVFLPMYLRKGYTTLPEFMEERYGVGVRRMVSILFLIGYLVIGIPVCLYAGAIAFEQIFDFATVFGISEGMALTILIVLVGIIGALYGFYSIYGQRQRDTKEKSSWKSMLLLIGAGIVHGMFVSGGPLLIGYLSNEIKEKTSFRATISTVWIILNSMILVQDICAGMWNAGLVMTQCISIPFLIAGMAAGSVLVKRMSQEIFMKLTYILLFISGILLMVK